MVEERKDKSAMKRRYIPLLMATGVCLGSCVGVQMVNLPDMPYKKPIQQTTLPPNTAPVPTATTPAAPGATNSRASGDAADHNIEACHQANSSGYQACDPHHPGAAQTA